MNNLIISINAVLPLMLCMGAGYLFRRLNLAKADDAFYSKCNALCFKTFLPLMLFVNIYDSDLSTAASPALFAYALGGILLVFFLCFLIIPRLVKEDSRRAVLIQGIFRSNYVIFGVPIAINLYGTEKAATAALLAAVAVPAFNVLAVVALEYYSPNKTGMKSVLIGILKNPLIWGAVIGLLFQGLHLTLPQPVYKAVSDLGKMATPLALVALGATFRFTAVRKNLRYLAIGVLGRIVAVPLLLLPLGAALGFRDVSLLSLVVLFASPTAVSSYTMAAAAGHDAELAGQQVVFTSIASLFSVFLWILLFKTLGMI